MLRGRVRRRRSGEECGDNRRLQVSQCRTGLHRADALLRAGRRLFSLPGAVHRLRRRGSSSATAWRRARPWARSPIRAGSTRWKSFVNDAKERGGKIQTGGSRHGNQGFFFQPTVITDVPDDSKIMTQEPFGPVAPIVSFKTFDEVVERANSLEFGLAAYAFTTSAATASAIGDAIQSGMVGVNSVAVSTPETPFGGVKESGYGSEGGIEGLQAYLNTKFISQA